MAVAGSRLGGTLAQSCGGVRARGGVGDGPPARAHGDGQRIVAEREHRAPLRSGADRDVRLLAAHDRDRDGDEQRVGQGQEDSPRDAALDEAHVDQRHRRQADEQREQRSGQQP